MSDRGTTNVLLAIIAGVLLFGQGAMVGALKWVPIAGLTLVVVVVAFRILTWILAEGSDGIEEVIKEWRSDAPLVEKATSTVGLLMLPLGAWFGLTWLWMWFSGNGNVNDMIYDTWAGRAWMTLLFVLFGGAALLLVARCVFWLLGHRSELPGRIQKALLYWLLGFVAFIALPINEFRHRREEGSGGVGLVLAPAAMVLVGVAVSFATIAVTGGVSLGVLAAIGYID